MTPTLYILLIFAGAIGMYYAMDAREDTRNETSIFFTLKYAILFGLSFLLAIYSTSQLILPFVK